MSPVTVYHVEDGPPGAPPLVLMNSLGSDLRMWDPQVAALRSAYRVIRFDTRGHGRSPVPPGPYQLSDLGGDALALLDKLDLARASLCGLSLGGMVGMWLAAHAPERVDRLVLCCTSARLGPAQAWAERAALVRAEGTAAVAAAVVGRWFTPSFAARHRDVVAAMREMVAATPAEGYAGCCAAIERMDLVPDLPKITAPTLVLAGADDPATPAPHASLIAAEIPGARLALIRSAAHLASYEQPDVVTALIRNFLEP